MESLIEKFGLRNYKNCSLFPCSQGSIRSVETDCEMMSEEAQKIDELEQKLADLDIELRNSIYEGRYEDTICLSDEILSLEQELWLLYVKRGDVLNVDGYLFEGELRMAEPKSAALILSNRPLEAIAYTTSILEKIQSIKVEDKEKLERIRLMKGEEISSELWSPFSPSWPTENRLLQSRAIAYLMVNEKEQAIADLKNSGLMDDLENTLFLRAIENKLGISILDQKVVSQAELKQMSTSKKIDFFLMNGDPQKALEWMASEEGNNSLYLEKKSIALALNGDDDQALQCLNELIGKEVSAGDVNAFTRELIYFMKGDFSQVKELDKEYGFGLGQEYGDFAFLPIVHYLESIQYQS